MQTLLNQVKEIFDNEQFIFPPEHLYQPIDYTLRLGGKRIRPLLLLAANQMFGGDPAQVRNAALGIETFHNFTLLHDDLMDKSPLRRGQPTVYRKWDENTAILSGDTMFALAWRYFLRQPHARLHDILNCFNETAIQVCEGQQYDMDFEQRMDVKEAEYIEMIRLKTSVLLAGSLKIGAILADAPAHDADLLYDFGICLGLAFQLKDDLLDVYGDPAVFGKKNGGDILCNKKTFLLIKALEMANPSQRQELYRWIELRDFFPQEKIEAVTSLYNIIGVDRMAERLIDDYTAKAARLLDEVSASDERKAVLRQLMDGLKTREV